MSDIDEKDRSRDRSRRDRPSRFSEPARDRSRDRGREPRSMKSSNNRVYVSNIPYEYRWQDMKDLFRNQIGDVQFVELFVDDNDKPKGCGIVEFSDSMSVKKCVELMQRYEVKGRKLVIKDDSGNIRDKHGSLIGGNKRPREERFSNRDDHFRDSIGGGQMSMRQDDGNTYGLSPNFLESLNIDAPLCNRVFVANLEYNIDKKKLKEVFRVAGRVIRVEVPLDKDGRSRGFAIVEYDHPVEAVQAISMLHNQFMFDRPMTVRMDRANETFKMPEGLKAVGMGLGPNGTPLKNVAHNLPSLGGGNAQSGVGAGILGAVPNNSLQLANALTGLGGVGNLGNLANQQMLQAANLSGLASNLLGNGLGAADLSSLVAQNPLQNQATQQQLAALAAQQNSSSNMQSSGSNNYGRGGGGDNSYGGQGGNSYGSQNQNQGYGNSNNMNRGFQSQAASTPSFNSNNSGFGNNDHMPFGGSGGAPALRGNADRNMSDKGSFQRKVLVSNLPPSASYKMLHEKFTEYGDIVACEEKLPGSIIITYGSEWQAERAIKNLDRARIDGRMIDARLFY